MQSQKNDTLRPRLDPGLTGSSAQYRMDLMRANLKPPASGPESVDTHQIQALVDQFAQGLFCAKDTIRAYGNLAHFGRWPIFVAQPAPNISLESAQKSLIASGFMLDPSLLGAYAHVGLLPVRCPPELPLVQALSRNPAICRLERSWIKGSLPALDTPGPTTALHPEKIIRPETLPSELLSRRDPLKIGMIDSGIDATHITLKKRLLDQRSFRRKVNANGDQIGHGTAVAGVISHMCASASFLSAKVFDAQGRTNLDDVLRALGWLCRHKPDLIVLHVQLDLPHDGHSILSHVINTLSETHKIPIIIPSALATKPAAPISTKGIAVSTSWDPPHEAQHDVIAPTPQSYLVPLSLQGNKDRYPIVLDGEIDQRWTVLHGPTASSAMVAGCCAVMVRAARMARQNVTPSILRGSLLLGSHSGTLSPEDTVGLFIRKLLRSAPAGSQLGDEPTTAIAITSSAPWKAFEEPTTQLVRMPSSVGSVGADEDAATIAFDTVEANRRIQEMMNDAKKTDFD